MRTSLATDALAMAITGGHAPAGVIFHSDRGCQYQCHSVKPGLGRVVG
jgi:transposase InsO family protein